MSAAVHPVEAVRVYLDGDRFGDGWRVVLLVEPGRLNVTVFHEPTLQAVRLRLTALRRAEPVLLTPYAWRRMAARIDARRRLFRKKRMRHNQDLAKRVAAACRARASGAD